MHTAALNKMGNTSVGLKSSLTGTMVIFFDSIIIEILVINSEHINDNIVLSFSLSSDGGMDDITALALDPPRRYRTVSANTLGLVL
jgi:hypothetical protein